MHTMQTQGFLEYIQTKSLELGVLLVCVFFLIPFTGEAATITTYSDRLSNSAPGEASNHTINFKTTASIPAGSFIRFTPEQNAFEIPATNFDIDNVMLYVSTGSEYVLRAATTSVSATEDGITINIPKEDRNNRNLKKGWNPKTEAGAREVIFLDANVGSMVNTYFITNPKGLEFSRQRAGQIVKSLGKLINKPNLHPHALRSTYANNLVYQGVNTNTLTYYMGWSDLKTANNYVKTSKFAARKDLKEKFSK